MTRASRRAELFFALVMVAVPAAAFFAAGSLHGWQKIAVMGAASLVLQTALPALRDAWRRR